MFHPACDPASYIGTGTTVADGVTGHVTGFCCSWFDRGFWEMEFVSFRDGLGKSKMNFSLKTRGNNRDENVSVGK